jgi:hypothetical protein
VVEVDVGDEDVPDVAGGQAAFAQAVEHDRQRRSGAGLDQHRPVGGHEQIDGRHAGQTLEVGVDQVDGRQRAVCVHGLIIALSRLRAQLFSNDG